MNNTSATLYRSADRARTWQRRDSAGSTATAAAIERSFMVSEMSQQIARLTREVDDIRSSSLPDDKLSLLVFSGDLDKLMAAFVIATGAAAMFDEVTMFFTYWGMAALRDPRKVRRGKDAASIIIDKLLPRGSSALSLSRWNLGGLGARVMNFLLRKKNAFSLEQLIDRAARSGVKIYVCEMSMGLMGFSMDEMIDYPGIKSVGVGTFLLEAGTSKSTLFI